MAVVAASAGLPNDPRFPALATAYADALLAPYGDDATRRFLHNGSRYVLGVALVGLDVAWQAGRGALPTVSLVQGILGGRRRVADQVAAFEKLGLATRETDAGDQRRKRLAPTPVLVEAVGRHARAAIALHAALGAAPPLAIDTRTLATVVAAIAAMRSSDGDMLTPFPSVARFALRDGGYQLLLVLYRQRDAAAGKPPSLQVLAGRLAVSKSQVAAMVRDGLAAGDLTKAKGGGVALSEPASHELERFIAGQCVLFGAAAAAVVAAAQAASMDAVAAE